MGLFLPLERSDISRDKNIQSFNVLQLHTTFSQLSTVSLFFFSHLKNILFEAVMWKCRLNVLIKLKIKMAASKPEVGSYCKKYAR